MSLNGAQGAGMSWRDVGGLYMKLEEERVDMGARGETGEWMRFQGVKLCPESQIEWSREPRKQRSGFFARKQHGGSPQLQKSTTQARSTRTSQSSTALKK